ncbi:MAG: type III-B CRISPR module RAMP protein Cmr1, partial [Chlorobiales bacterium]|nr:type III-B CRISPR module RAMP protein Cmr1 [Chlorobiales bacterium]
VQGDRIAAKIHMSRPYADGVIRVWGWVPVDADVWNSKWNRDSVLTKIKNHLASNYALKTWREFNNARDKNQQYSDIRAFLHSLWEGNK